MMNDNTIYDYLISLNNGEISHALYYTLTN